MSRRTRRCRQQPLLRALDEPMKLEDPYSRPRAVPAAAPDLGRWTSERVFGFGAIRCGGEFTGALNGLGFEFAAFDSQAFARRERRSLRCPQRAQAHRWPRV